jgi:hypothetical protein
LRILWKNFFDNTSAVLPFSKNLSRPNFRLRRIQDCERQLQPVWRSGVQCMVDMSLEAERGDQGDL